MRVDPVPDAIILPPVRSLPVAPEPGGRAILDRHILDDRCRTRDLFSPQPVPQVDPKAPIRFSAYLEKQNREKPDFTLGERPHPCELASPRVQPPCSDAPAADGVPPGRAAAPKIGEATPPDPRPSPAPGPEERQATVYHLHRPIPSGMTIDVFA